MQVEEQRAAFAKCGVAILAVGFEPAEHLAEWRPVRSFTFPVVTDPSRQIYESLGAGKVPLRRLLAPRVLRHYWRLYRRWGRPAAPRDDPWQLGGDFLVDDDGRVLWGHICKDPADRPEVKKLLEEVRRVWGT